MPVPAIAVGIASLAGKAFKDPGKFVGGVKKIGGAIGKLFGKKSKKTTSPKPVPTGLKLASPATFGKGFKINLASLGFPALATPPGVKLSTSGPAPRLTAAAPAAPKSGSFGAAVSQQIQRGISGDPRIQAQIQQQVFRDQQNAPPLIQKRQAALPTAASVATATAPPPAPPLRQIAPAPAPAPAGSFTDFVKSPLGATILGVVAAAVLKKVLA